MTRRPNAHLVAVLCACTAALALPALGEASSGGGGLSSSGRSSQSTGSPGTAQPGNVPVSASGGGMSIQTRSSALLANGLRFTGSAPSRDAGRTVEIERSGHETNWAWTPTVQARVGSDGSFSAVWQTNHIGRFAIRAVLSSGQNGGATTSSDWPTVTVIVYRPSIATWYADNGSRTACGVVLHKNTLGVANRTLPCGTQVAFYYRGKSVIVPVIDRGPYANHADWDLTQATARILSVYSVGVAHLGAVSLPRR